MILFVRKRFYTTTTSSITTTNRKLTRDGIIFIDTETAGLGSSPRLLQLGWQLRDSSSGKLLNTYTSYIKPEPPFFYISKQATEVHGITHRKLYREGRDLRFVLSLLYQDLLKADSVIAHNMPFDERVIQGTLTLVNDNSLKTLWNEKEKLCTMEMAGALPQFRKRPSLAAVFETLTGRKSLLGAHSADVDVEMCATCYYEIKKILKREIEKGG